jgi:hypothetical protein
MRAGKPFLGVFFVPRLESTPQARAGAAGARRGSEQKAPGLVVRFEAPPGSRPRGELLHPGVTRRSELDLVVEAREEGLGELPLVGRRRDQRERLQLACLARAQTKLDAAEVVDVGAG